MVKKRNNKPEKSQFQHLLDSFLVESAIPESLKQSFSNINIHQRFIPGLCRFASKKKLSKFSTFRTRATLIKWKPSECSCQPKITGACSKCKNDKFGIGTIQYSNGTIEEKRIFIKTIHLLDPFTFVKGEYGNSNKEEEWIPNLEDSYEERHKKLNSTYNQAYIDATAQAIVSRLKEEDITPHALLSYGMISGIQKSYWYDITNDFESLRARSWFWDSVGHDGKCLKFTSTTNTELDKDFIESLRTRPEILYDSSEEDEEDDENEELEEESEELEEESDEESDELEEESEELDEESEESDADATSDKSNNDTNTKSTNLESDESSSVISADSLELPAAESPASSSSAGFEEYYNEAQKNGIFAISRQNSFELNLETLEESASIKSADNSEVFKISRLHGDSHTCDGTSHDFEAGVRIQIECTNMPVLLLFQEAADGTMESLLEEEEERINSMISPTSTSDLIKPFSMSDSMENIMELIHIEKEDRWSAWLLQIIAALSQLQALISFCHNDLHTNNIVWTKTPIEYLYYKRQNGDFFKVPTYGKLFHLIDYGRATFSIGDRMFISDDFFEGNDACGQYNYGACFVTDQPVIYPNTSFDLCRLAVSLLDSLYAETPSTKSPKNPILMNTDGQLKKYETTSPLYNIIWKWLLDDNEQSVLRDLDGEDRFPGFDLYIHISKHVHNAVPKLQYDSDPFIKFKVNMTHPSPIKVYC